MVKINIYWGKLKFNLNSIIDCLGKHLNHAHHILSHKDGMLQDNMWGKLHESGNVMIRRPISAMNMRFTSSAYVT